MLKINFALGAPCTVTLELVDMSGRRVKSLANGYHSAGKYTQEISTADLAEGNYLCKLSAAGVTQSKRVMVIRKAN